MAHQTGNVAARGIERRNGAGPGPTLDGDVTAELASFADGLASVATRLTEAATELSSSADETQGQAQSVADATEKVGNSIALLAQSADEMTTSISEIASHAADAVQVATGALALAEEANAGVETLGEASADIGKVVKLITGIAQQTNLLALNATIEAARAGEAGKGFAVVANEVKELAKETARATGEISAKVEAIQAGIAGTVDAIGRIREVMNRINDMQAAIAGAVEQQTASTRETSRNVEAAAHSTNDIACTIGGVAMSAFATTEGAGLALAAAADLAAMATDLQRLLSNLG